MKNIDLSLVLPVHNQQDIIIPVVLEIIRDLNKHRINYEILLVENGSIDKTLNTVRKFAAKNTRIKALKAKKGYGSAIIAGLEKSTGKYVSYMPSDGQLNPSLVSKLYKIIKTDNYDLVKIRRTTRESFIRSIRSNIFNILAGVLFKIDIIDINGSPRIFLRNWLPFLKLHYKDSFIDTEMAIKTHYMRWNLKEIPAETLPRRGGKSTVSFKTVLEFLKNFLDYKKSSALKIWIKSVT